MFCGSFRDRRECHRCMACEVAFRTGHLEYDAHKIEGYWGLKPVLGYHRGYIHVKGLALLCIPGKKYSS